MGSRTADDHARLLKELNEERIAALTRISGTLESVIEQLRQVRERLSTRQGSAQERDVAAYRELHQQAVKYRWYLEVQREAIGLRHHQLWGGPDKVAHCRRTGIELLIDDSAEDLRRAVAAGILAATLRHPWNDHVCDGAHITCGADWPELARVLQPVLEGAGGGR